jgi:hypothetical protein
MQQQLMATIAILIAAKIMIPVEALPAVVKSSVAWAASTSMYWSEHPLISSENPKVVSS